MFQENDGEEKKDDVIKPDHLLTEKSYKKWYDPVTFVDITKFVAKKVEPKHPTKIIPVKKISVTPKDE